jgi:hypothetical protein
VRPLQSFAKHCYGRSSVLLLTMTMAALGCEPLPPQAPAGIRQSEVRHCIEEAPALAAIGLASRVDVLSPTARKVHLTNSRDSPVRLQKIQTHLGFTQCGYGGGNCHIETAASDVDLAPGQSLDLLVDSSLDKIPYPCTTVVLAVTVRISSSEQACSDVASWTAVQETED